MGRKEKTDEVFIGQVFEQWTVVAEADTKGGHRFYKVKCSCGDERVIRKSNLVLGHSLSCGCMREGQRLIQNTDKSEYFDIWKAMIHRCTNPNSQHFARYGGRGITVCDEWLHDLAAFTAYLGPRPSDQHSIDRIDNDGNYEPGNVRWATRIEQANNRSNTLRLEFQGQTKMLAEWCEELGLSRGTVYERLTGCNWSVERALTTPIIPRRKTAKKPTTTPLCDYTDADFNRAIRPKGGMMIQTGFAPTQVGV